MDDRALVEALAAAPRRLRELLGGRDDARTRRRRGEHDWSAAEILLHLRASDAILASRIPLVLARPGIPLPGVDERAYGRVLERTGPSVAEQVEAFEARRRELVAVLRALAPEEWETTGQHEELGAISVRGIVERIVEHEAEHLAQMEAALR
ncbi:MAG TPA: DinB family protein [Chloroflexota bacterium]|nr:DinB family protein [Chloroflexota bacterium]